MKFPNKSIFFTLVILLFQIAAFAQTSGELTVSVSTSKAGGNYAPRNIVSIWIEDASGKFVKTLLAYADKRKTHLNNWQASTNAAGSEYNKVDAITGATKSSHGTRNCSWDGIDYLGSNAEDGEYFVKMELTDKNSTGNYSSFSFTKGLEFESQNPADKPSFSSVSIIWTPSTSSLLNAGNSNEDFYIFPNPGHGNFKIVGNEIKDIEVRDITGQLLHKTKSKNIDICDFENGMYLVSITNNNGEKFIRKFVKH